LTASCLPREAEPGSRVIDIIDLSEKTNVNPYGSRATKRTGTYRVSARRGAGKTKITNFYWQDVTLAPDVVHISTDVPHYFSFEREQNQHADSKVEVFGWQLSQAAQTQLFSTISLQPKPVSADPVAVRILRVHFLKDVLDALASLTKQAATPRAADYANSLFKAMRVIRDTLPSDPFSAIIIALHDSLAYKNRWAEYTGQQYQQASDILLKYANQDLKPDRALKAVLVLEEIGFNTTPFEALTQSQD